MGIGAGRVSARLRAPSSFRLERQLHPAQRMTWQLIVILCPLIIFGAQAIDAELKRIEAEIEADIFR